MIAALHGAHAMMDGARKYGPFNWRDKKVQAHIYVDAALRHIAAWFDGEELADDSKVHHLGHAIACCAILLDAQATDSLIDDRPVNGKNKCVLSKVLKELQVKVQEKLTALQAESGFEISVNGNKVITKLTSLTYEAACALANLHASTQPTVTWKAPDGKCGSIYPGYTYASVCPGLILNVIHTNNA